MAEKGQTRTARRQEQQKTKKNKSSRWKKVGVWVLTVSLVAIVGVSALFGYYIISAPELNAELLRDPQPNRFLDINGNVFAESGSERRTEISYDELPEILVDAVIAAEDARFFKHSGIDFRRIGGAVLASIRRGSIGAEGGASTITQQVIRGSFLSTDQTIKRKVQEQWLALQLERAYDKEEILEMYLNKIFYGQNAYGVAAAAETFFGITDLDELSLSQAALLAGLPQRPSAYNPAVNPDLAHGRMETVLSLMVRHEKITQEEADEAMAVSMEDMLNLTSRQGDSYHGFLDQVRIEIEEKLGADAFNEGLIVHTTLDPDAQEHVEYVLSDNSPINYPDSEIQAGLVVIDTQSGAIRAVGPGRDREVGGFNMAIQAKRQPGSAIKPILDYGPAIEHLNWSTYEQINNSAPYEIAGSDKVVRNWNDEYSNRVSARYGMQWSLNVPALEALDAVGIGTATEFAESIGVPIPENGLTIGDGIGGSTLGMSALDMAGAYTAFGNGGIYNEPYAVREVEFHDGTTQSLKSEPVAVMSDATAYMITDMLKTVVQSGTGTSASVSGLPIAGKTGSTDDNVDIWFSGYTTNYTIAVWSGYHESSTRSVPDTQISRQLFRNVMSELSVNIETADFEMPDSVVRVQVERGSNPAKLPSAYTPDSQIVTELFKRGYEPTQESEQFEQLDPVANLSAQYNEESNQIDVSWSYSGDEDVSFNINYGTNGSSGNDSSTSEQSFTISNVERGAVYTIEVTVANDNLTSESRQVDIQVPEENIEDETEEPEQEIEQPVVPDDPDDDPEQPDDNNGAEQPEEEEQEEDPEPEQEEEPESDNSEQDG
ncbi:penicillin-binding protein 1A [Amphibacillus marinus]|uniref:Penicillin-binding protein 1A n=1 Tax=Amphibacillus marinus TaxID=872970 RepID=A0A1H8GJN9_9BACI|nr:penicillin-binding protein 1A [Amphibacillus marinus]SEN44226.1 penicillin-binding protein 1A [Amphibacillus marinus]